MITSNQIASNNSVIIAKLKLGFQIAGIEIFDEIGTVVKLVHFLSPLRQEVFSYRTGEAYPSTRVKRVLGFSKKRQRLAT
jgi:hypothetical protein